MSFISGTTNNKYFKGVFELGAAGVLAGSAHTVRPILGQKGVIIARIGAAILGLDALRRTWNAYQQKPVPPKRNPEASPTSILKRTNSASGKNVSFKKDLTDVQLIHKHAIISFYFPYAKSEQIKQFDSIDAAYNALCFPAHAEEFTEKWHPDLEILRKRNQELRVSNPVPNKEIMKLVIKNWLVHQISSKDHPSLSDANLMKMTHPDFPDFGQMALEVKREVEREIVIFGTNLEAQYRSAQIPMGEQFFRGMNYVETRYAASQMFPFSDWVNKKEDAMFGSLITLFKEIGFIEDEKLKLITHPDFPAFGALLIEARNIACRPTFV